MVEWEPGRYNVEKFKVQALLLHRELQAYAGTDVDASASGTQFLFRLIRENIGSTQSFREVWSVARPGADLTGVANHRPLYDVCFPGVAFARWPTSRKLNSLSFIRDLRDALASRPIMATIRASEVRIEPFSRELTTVIS